jgi:hypothetical protein
MSVICFISVGLPDPALPAIQKTPHSDFAHRAKSELLNVHEKVEAHAS